MNIYTRSTTWNTLLSFVPNTFKWGGGSAVRPLAPHADGSELESRPRQTQDIEIGSDFPFALNPSPRARHIEVETIGLSDII
jgi:hypothetical protein